MTLSDHWFHKILNNKGVLSVMIISTVSIVIKFFKCHKKPNNNNCKETKTQPSKKPNNNNCKETKTQPSKKREQIFYKNTLECLLEKYTDKPWNWHWLSENRNITMDYIEKNPDKPWD